MKFYWTKKAREDLVSIGRYISRDNSQAAKRTVYNIRNCVLVLKKNSFSGRQVPEINDMSVREIIYRNYRIVYKIKPDSIDILMVFEGHKLFDK